MASVCDKSRELFIPPGKSFITGRIAQRNCPLFSDINCYQQSHRPTDTDTPVPHTHMHGPCLDSKWLIDMSPSQSAASRQEAYLFRGSSISMADKLEHVFREFLWNAFDRNVLRSMGKWIGKWQDGVSELLANKLISTLCRGMVTTVSVTEIQ